METSYRIEAMDGGSCDLNIEPTLKISVHGTEKQIIEVLRTLYEEELIGCNHEITEYVPVDDDRHFDGAGNLHEHSNPDALRCIVCGKYWHPAEEEWRDE
jgi:hypothetical protein